MPVLVGTPSMIVISRVQTYQSCSVDLSWQTAVHACQRCPKSALPTSAMTVTPINQPGFERPKSRFCPAGVHMSNCLPASEIFGVLSKSAAHPTLQTALGSNDLLPNCTLSWGPPNLPLPAVSPNHPVHAANMARASYPSSVSTTSLSLPATSTLTIPDSVSLGITSTSLTTVHHFYPTDSTVRSTTSIGSTTSATITPTSASSTLNTVSSVDLISSPRKESLSSVRQESVPNSKVDNNAPKLDDIKSAESARPDEVAEGDALMSSHTDRNDMTENAINGAYVLNQNLADDSTSIARDGSETIDNSLDTTGESNPVEKNSASHINVKSSRIDDSAGWKNGRLTSQDQTASGRVTPNSRTINDFKEDANKFDRQTKIVNQASTLKQQKYRESTIGTESTTTGTNQFDKFKPNNATANTPRQKQQQQIAFNNHRESSEATNRASAPHTSTMQEVNNETGTSSGGVGDVALSKSANRVCTPTSQHTTIHYAKHVVKNSSADNIPSVTGKQAIPPLCFSLGTTLSTLEINSELDRIKQELNKLPESLNSENKTTEPSIPYSSFGQVAKILNCPFYWKYPVYMTAGGTSEKSPLPVSSILKMWSNILTICSDDASKFVHLLTKGHANYLVQSDLSTLIQDILESHPGLAFLEAAKDFHSRYVTTVVARIYFNVNVSWSGRITLGELRRSNFLAVLISLEQEEDINLITEYFSYEHFYVIYCKFWELDEDHDLIISRSDLARHNNYAISERMIDRIFCGAVTRGSSFKEGVMTYPDFVWFLLAEEDKRHPRSIEYWFRCMDLDGDGLLSMYELEYFYSEQLARMEEMGIEPISFEDCLCQCLDMVKPVLGNKIRLSDMKQCRLCHTFFDTFFNLPKYLQHEQRDPFANLRDIEEGLNELSDWNRYAAEAYEMLVNVEGVNQEDGVDEDEEDDVDEVEEDEVIDNTGGLVINPHANRGGRKSSSIVTNTNNNNPDNNVDDGVQIDEVSVDTPCLINKMENVNTDHINLQPTTVVGE